MKRVLIVSGYFPYPPIHGGKIDVWNNIKVLYELGYKLDLVVTEKHTYIEKQLQNEVSKYVSKIFIVQRKNKLEDIFSLLPLQIKSRQLLKNIKLENKYDFIILEGDYVSEILKNKTLFYDNILLRSQNNEIKYFYNLFRSTNKIINKLYYFTDYLKFKIFTPKLYRKIKNILFISCDEKEEFCANIKKAIHILILIIRYQNLIQMNS